MIPADAWPEWADRHCWDEDGIGLFYGAVPGASASWCHKATCSGIPMPAGLGWRVPVIRPSEQAPDIDLGRFYGVIMRSFDACLVGADAELLCELLDLIDGRVGRVLPLIDGQAKP